MQLVKKKGGSGSLFKSMYRRSIQFITSISFSVVAVLGIVFMGVVLTMRFATDSKEWMMEDNRQLVEQVSLNLDNYIRNMMRISDTMYYTVIKNVDLDSETLTEEMNLLYEANKDELVSISCFTEDGELVDSTPVTNLKEDVDVTKQDWFVKANNKIENLHFSTAHVQNLFEDNSYRYYWVISLSRAVELTEQGKTSRGILLVDMNFSGIQQLFNKVNTKVNGYVYLMDNTGKIIYHPKQKQIYSNLASENNLKAAEYEDGTHVEEYEGEERAVVVKTVGYTGWKVVSVIPTRDFYINSGQMQFFFVVICAFTIFIIIFTNLVVSSKIADPIKKLENSVKELEDGNLNLDIYIGGTPEIQHLGRTILSTVKQMRELMDDIVKEQEEKRKSEFDALQSQINPHFLYNTLDSIVWMIEGEKYEGAISMVTALAKLFRISLSKGKNIITIEEEIHHAQSYLSIQKVRYKNRFDVEFEIDEEIVGCNTIKLIVQPLLENAIYYGMEYMDGDGIIKIKGYRQEEDVYIEVEDNGLGMPQEVVDALLTDDTRVRKKGSGIGLRNVHERIQLYFGGEYGLIIESEPDKGTVVKIHLPFSTDKIEDVK